DIIEDRGRVLDRIIADNNAGGLEAREGESLDIFLEWNAILQAKRDGDGEIVHHGTEGGTFLVHVDEDLADAAIIILAGADINLVPANKSFLRITLAPVRQFLALARYLLDNALDDLFRYLRGARRGRGGDQCLQRIIFLVLILDQRCIERL